MTTQRQTCFLALCAITAALFVLIFTVPPVNAAAVNVRILGPSTSYAAHDVSAIATQLNNMFAATSGYSGSSASATVLSGRSLTEAYYHPSYRVATRAAVTGDYDYLVILPETAWLYSYPEMTFDGVLQMSRKALGAGTTPLLLMPGTGNTDYVSILGTNSYRIANGCGIQAVPGGYAAQSSSLLDPAAGADQLRQAYLLAATLFTKITGLNAASGTTYAPSIADYTTLAGTAVTSINTHQTTVHYATSRENSGLIRCRTITPPGNVVRYAWAGTSTETGINAAMPAILQASGYTVGNYQVNGTRGWSDATTTAATTNFSTYPNQYQFVYARDVDTTATGQSVINVSQANLLPIAYDQHYTPVSNNDAALDDVYGRTEGARSKCQSLGWVTVPVHLGVARLNDVDPTILFSADTTHWTAPVYSMICAMMATSTLGGDPTPTSAILANSQQLNGFNVGKQTIKQLAFLAETGAYVPDTTLAVVTPPALEAVQGLAFSYTLTATGGTAPYTWSEESSAGLPAGLTISSGGSLSGIATAGAGTWQLVVKVKDSTGAVRKAPVTLSVVAGGSGPGKLALSSADGLNPAGVLGGPFSPASQSYTLSNIGTTPINWTAAKTVNWVNLSATTGTLAAGANTTVTVSVNSNANALAIGSYNDIVTFTNTTNGSGNAARAVVLKVNPPPATVTLTPATLSQTYSGGQKIVTATTVPAGLSYSVTYNGSTTAPTNAGTYAVVATVTDPNYAGSTSGTLTIAKASQSITFGALATVLDNAGSFALTGTASSALTVSYASSNASVATVSGNTVTVVGVGSATITASQSGDSNYNAATSVQQTLNVVRSNPLAVTGGPYSLPVGLSLALNGSGSQPSNGASITAYQWDLNNDGIFGDVTGATPAAISYSTLITTWGRVLGPNTIQLKVTDSAGKTSTTSTTLTLIAPLTWDANGATAGQTDGAGGWLTANQWWDGSANATWASGANAILGNGGTGGAVTLASATSINSLTLNSFTGTYTLGTSTSTITLNNGVVMNTGAGAAIIVSPIALTGAQTWSNSSANTLSFTGAITGTGGLTKDGTGALILNPAGTSSYTGTTLVSSGVLNIQKATSLGAVADGTIVADGAELQIQGGITVGAESLTLNGSGVADTGALRNISGTNIYGGLISLAGDVRINSDAGSLTLNNAGTISGAGLALSFGGAGTITLNSVIATTNGGINKDGTGTLILSPTSDTSNFTGLTVISGGVLNIQKGSALGSVNDGTIVMTGAALQIQGAINVGIEPLSLEGTGVSNSGALRNISGNNTFGGLITLTGNARINSDSGTLTVSNPSTITGPGLALIFGGAGNVTVNSIIGTTTGTVTKDGGGTLTLSAINTFSGGLVINGGNVTMGGTGIDSLGAANSSVTVNATTGLTVNGVTTIQKSFTLNNGAMLNLSNGSSGITISGAVTGTGGVSPTGAGSLGQRYTTLSSTSNTFSGPINNPGSSNNADLVVNSLYDGVGAGNINYGENGQARNMRVAWGTGATTSLTLANRQLVINGTTPTAYLSNNNTTAANTVTVTTNLVNNSTGAATFALGGANSGNNTFAGIIGNGSGTINLSKVDAGLWILSGANTYTGVINVTGGTLSLSSIDNVANPNPLGRSSAAAANLLLGNGTTLRYTGPAASCDRAFTINGTGAGHSATINASGSGAVNFTNSASPAYGTTAQTRTLILAGSNTDNNTLAANITDNGGGLVSLNKMGPGKWVLTGTNSYTGTTTISAGTVFINGNQTLATGAVSVANGAALGGAGIIGGSTTIAAGGKLEFDISTDYLTHNSLELASGKTLTFSGTSVLTITSSGGALAGTYTLVTAPGGIVGSVPATVNLPSGWTATVAKSGNSLVLNVTAVPGGSPGTLAVTPAGGLSSSGNYGGPFSPASVVYTLTNPGTTSIDWTASKTTAWVDLSTTSGTLAAGANTTVTVSINSNANTLVAASYNDTVTFANATNGNGNTTRVVALTVNPGPYTVTYDGNSNTGGSAPSSQLKNHNVGLTLSGAGTLVRSGYAFSGWNTAANGSGTPYAAGATYSANVAVTLYAQWNANPTTNAGSDQSGSLSVAWNPTSAGPLAWYDASDTASITQVSGAVSQWNDKVGSNHMVQGTSNMRPLSGTTQINGLNSIAFDGTDDALKTASNPFGASISNAMLIGVFNVGTINTGTTLFSLTGSSADANRWQSHAPWSDGTAYFDCGGINAPNRISAPSGFTASQNKLLGYYCSTIDSVQQVWVDGTSLVSDATGHTVSTSSGIALGYDGASSYDNCRVGEVMVINGAVSASNRQKLEGYLAHKWGLAGSLPAAHPYKSVSPTTTYVVLNLTGTASDPNGDALTTTWSVVSGPGSVSFGNANALSTTATFTVAGTYTLRLTAADPTSSITDDVVITIKNANDFFVTYNANSATGGTAPATQIKTQGVNLTLATNSGSLVRTGYVFAGWNTAANGSGTSYTPGSTYAANADLVLYAKWTPKTTPTVSVWPTAASIVQGQALSSATLSGGSASVAGSFGYDTPATTPAVGTYAAALTFTPTDTTNYNTVAGTVNVTVLTVFNGWAGAGKSFSGDVNGDGVADGMAWLLGATTSGQNAAALVPPPSVGSGSLVVGFKCLKATKRGSAVLKLQYSNDLGATDLWTSHSIAVPESSGPVGGVSFTITPDPVNTDLNQVQATVPASAAGTGGKIFVRLTGEMP